ncbi:endo-1,4-beta-xylanase [Winogradskyella sp. SYSU M77433]|uniref:endo-1,4-beta-xylanase n=1 Tax=Winogradskyella sp. SYSU M77433 TaxID=3042722 RepID=UPI002481176D|nr:endo-1,4-beta-xylanase [Winogradskyella sp. SYSU M77433]MDH7911720.1 endo-1,4-beta-xylanase [Winogradskyella sp. SYSU M77433]
MKKIFLSVLVFGFILTGCSPDESNGVRVGGPTNSSDDDGGNSGDPLLYNPTENLKDMASFPIGNIVSASRLASSSETEFRSMLNNDYNSITAENDMKMANIFVGPDSFDFSDGDAIVAYAKANGMRVHGHALVWHPEYAIPDWLENFAGTDQEFEAHIENYVKTTVEHFAQEVDANGNSIVEAWDVVNEYFSDDGGIRSSLFTQRMGANYIERIFQWAREADPDVKLFYNDYNVAGQTNKRAAILSMATSFQNSGIPIDGIGMQMHLSSAWPSLNEVSNAITSVAGSGLLVHISELDIGINPDEDITSLTLERAQLQESYYNHVSSEYNSIVPAAQQYGITVWGVRDQDSWRYDGGTEWPLLYNENYEFKIAHRGFADGL